MIPIPLTWALAAALFTFVGGTLTGGVGVYKLWSYSTMRATITKLQTDNRRFRQALDLGGQIDTDDTQTELTNDQIAEALTKKTPPATVKVLWQRFKTTCPEPESDPVVIDADGMRLIGTLR
jgi:hypothetical protein